MKANVREVIQKARANREAEQIAKYEKVLRLYPEIREMITGRDKRIAELEQELDGVAHDYDRALRQIP